MALNNYGILTENEISKWNDITGERYHFPKRYLERLREGMKIIYYKGKTKKNGPHYFGYCEVGKIYPVAGNPQHYHADLVNYKDFNYLVPFKLENKYVEDTEKSGYYWQNSVRPIDEERFLRILKLSGLNLIETKNTEQPIIVTELPLVTEVNVAMATTSLIKHVKPEDKEKVSSSSPNYYNSKKSTLHGNQGEFLVMKYLRNTLSGDETSTLKHHAVEHEKNGYDISYKDSSGQRIYIEVKATSASSFPSFVITINELMAAERYGVAYKIYLVNKVTSKDVKIEVVENIKGLLEQGEFVKSPMAYKIEKKAQSLVR